jgi:hypothetical protein
MVVVWQSDNQQGGSSVFAQLYVSNGVPLGSEFRVNTNTPNAATHPHVAADTAGNFVVVWNQSDGSGSGIFARRFRANGAALGAEFRVNSVTTEAQTFSNVAVDGSGGFVVVWQTGDSNANIAARRFGSSGAPGGTEFRVNTYTTGSQLLPDVACDASGRFVVVWSGPDATGPPEVYAQRFAPSGAPLGGELLVNTATVPSSPAPRVAAFTHGGFVVTWESGPSSERDILAAKYLPSGAATGPPFRVNSYTTDQQLRPFIAIDENARGVVVWDTLGDGSLSGVYAQRYAFARVPGDMNGDATVDVLDVFYLINFLFASGPAPL